MIILTNSSSLTLGPGQSATFDTIVMQSKGGAECYRNGSGAVQLVARNALYSVGAGANIGASEVGQANLTVFLNGSPMPEMVMNSATAAVGDTNNVYRETRVKTCHPCCASETVTLVNNGDTTIVMENPIFVIQRVR